MKPRGEDMGQAPGSGGPSRGKRPSDLELMLWVDGELGAARASEVEAYLARDAHARALVDSLRLGSGLVQAHAEQWAEDHDGDRLVEDILDSASAEASRRWMAPPRRAPAWRTPAIAAAALGLAVAAAFAVVLRSVSHSQLSLGAGQGALVTPSAAVEASGDDGPIAVVDFGSRPGAVLYLDSDSAAPAAVVWLTDDDEGTQ